MSPRSARALLDWLRRRPPSQSSPSPLNLAQLRCLAYPESMATQSKTELLDNLRGMVRDMLRLRSEGGAYAKLARAHGYVDGYMRVLLETGIADTKTLLGLVAEERRLFDGAATAEVTVDASESAEIVQPGVRRVAAA